ncbi:MAG: hypothetical protein V3S36_08880, partial [Acidiferrobacterales bacterium]
MHVIDRAALEDVDPELAAQVFEIAERAQMALGILAKTKVPRLPGRDPARTYRRPEPYRRSGDP